LNKHHNNVLKVAETLNVGKSTIYRMLKERKV
jgi:excisionase family DNA binding protein